MSGHVLRRPSAEELMLLKIGDIVAGCFAVSFEALVSRVRLREVADARMAMLALARTHTGLPSTRLGLLLHLDHSSILHAAKRVRVLAEVDREFARKFAEATRRVTAEFAPAMPPPLGDLRLAPAPEDFLQPV